MKSALNQNRYHNKSGLSKSDQHLRFVSDETLSKYHSRREMNDTCLGVRKETK